MSVWSNIPDCARFMFRRLDPEFHDRALEWGGGLIVGGHNYGQGSSREQAALAALHLGIRAVVAKSFARIHRTNLVAQSVLPLVFADEDDYDAVSLGDTWTIEGVRAAVENGEEDLVARARGRRRDRAARRALGPRAGRPARGRPARARPAEIIPAVPHSGSVRRRQAGVLVVGAAEPEVRPGCAPRGTRRARSRDAAAALAALEEEPADLVIVDREPGGLDAPGVCRALREDQRLERRRGCWRSPSRPRAGWPTRRSTPAPTTTCTARSPAPSCSPAPAPACAPPSSAPTTRSCAR